MGRPWWESSIGRNDFQWCPDCQREISRSRESQRLVNLSALKRLQQRNAMMRKALPDDLPGLRAAWAQRSRSLSRTWNKQTTLKSAHCVVAPH